MKIYKLGIIIIFLFLFITSTNASGVIGCYTIKGSVFLKKRKLYDCKVFIEYGNIKDTINVDKNGNFSVDIIWSTLSPIGESKKEIKNRSKISNPKFIIFKYNGNYIKIRNKWKKAYKNQYNKNLKLDECNFSFTKDLKF